MILTDPCQVTAVKFTRWRYHQRPNKQSLLFIWTVVQTQKAAAAYFTKGSQLRILAFTESRNQLLPCGFVW